MALHRRFGTPKTKVKIEFAGIFDTVSLFSASSFNNVKMLRLAVPQNVKKVVHLAAGDEYRSNCSLTNISSSAGNGYEWTLPGAHSDIGGGYAAVEEESREVRLDGRDHYIAHGWYTPADVPVLREGAYSPQTGRSFMCGRGQWASAVCTTTTNLFR